MRRLAFLPLLPLVAFLFIGCSGDNESAGSGGQPYDGHPLVGLWLLASTTSHYQSVDDETLTPSDTTLFRFRPSGAAIFSEDTPQGRHEMLYQWSATDSTFTLESDVQLNNGTFPYEATDSTFTYEVRFSEPVFEGLTGWTYRYTRLE
ncbi:MAG: hypothetical protein MAG453_00076 [Calditrichaeota bacterium]|nr:hypothetical protein [Calditrichota bacterium]